MRYAICDSFVHRTAKRLATTAIGYKLKQFLMAREAKSLKHENVE